MISSIEKLKIAAFPTTSLTILFKGDKNRIPPLLPKGYSSSKTIFFYLGRIAIWNSMKIMDLSTNDNVLIPAYHCGVEVKAVLRADVKVKFYRIKENLKVDLNDLEKKIDCNSKAVMIIHYFGFPQPIKEIKALCEAKKLYLIEDCAHAFLSGYEGNYLGTYGDFGVLSMQKFLPIPDGGVLLINNSNYEFTGNTESPNLLTIYRTLILMFLKHMRVAKGNLFNKIIRISFLHPVKLVFKAVKEISTPDSLGVVNPTSVDFSPSMTKLGMSQISKKLLSNFDFNHIVVKRRNNYNFLLNKLKKFKRLKICFENLPDGVCPYFFPVCVEDRMNFQKELLKRGIETFIFGGVLHEALPFNDFNIARYFSDKVLALPVHQDLSHEHLSYMARSIGEILQGV